MQTELLVSRAGGRTCTALREDGVTVELRVEEAANDLAVGHIVKAKVSKVLPGIQSAFLDLGQERDAFLHAGDLLLPGEAASRAAYALGGEGDGDNDAAPPAPRRAGDGPPIEDRLKEGRELVVQIVREGFGGKGPRVTCFITLPGRYLVHAPQAAFRGLSRRIHDEAERQRLREVLASLPQDYGGFIVRTAGAGADAAAFEADARFLVETWRSIEAAAQKTPAPRLLHADLDLFLRSLRDAPSASFDRVIVDDPALHLAARSYLKDIDPQLGARVVRHTGDAPLFDETGVSQEIEKSLRPRVWLRSGGTIVIEPTEALVSIDVNTGKYLGLRRPEETVRKTNLEAAAEIARQLRLRDLGGIIVVDFIDMESAEDKTAVIAALEGALGRDRSRTKIVGLSELGLLQLTRKRTRPSIGAALTEACRPCSGSGRVKTGETVAYEALFEARRVASSFAEGELTLRLHPEAGRALRLALQSAAPIVDRKIAGRLRVVDDPAIAADHFDLSLA